MGALAPGHLIILLVIVLLLFGAKRLPEIGRGIGSGMREFKDGITGEEKEPPTPPVDVAPPVEAPPDEAEKTDSH